LSTKLLKIVTLTFRRGLNYVRMKKNIQSILRSIMIAAVLSGALLTGEAFDGVIVRVRETRGGPQIQVNGKPVPPRFFYGAYNTGTVTLKSEWTSHTFEFMPGEVSGTVLQVRFANEPGEIWITDLRIQNTEKGTDVLLPGSLATQEDFSKYWNLRLVDNADTANKVTVSDGVLHIVIKNRSGNLPDLGVENRASLRFVAGRSYRCSFRAMAAPVKELNVWFYDGTSMISSGGSGLLQYKIGPPGSFFSQVALAHDAGVDLVAFGAPACWTPPEMPDNWATMDNLFRQIIAVNPKALLVPRVSANAPDWWLKRHPGARMIYDGNSVINVSCISDRTYRADVCTYLEKLCRHLLKTFPDNFAGIHPVGQNTGEWFYNGSWDTPLSGYDPATRAAFRQWLKAHGDPLANTAEPPTADERRARPYGLLRDPAREKRLIGFALFQQQEMADHIAAMAAACRRGTDGKKLVIFFYGYAFTFSGLPNGAPTSGHYALSSLLKSKDIDILASPIEYKDRDWLGTSSSMTAAESVERAGILWLNEDDTHTFLSTRSDRLANIEQTRQVMRRNTVQAAIRGFGTWWMDLHGEDWFNDARIWEEMSLLNPVDVALFKRQTPFTPEIAAIVDEESMCHLTGGTDYNNVFSSDLIRDAPASLGRSGAPYGQYLLDDVLLDRVPAKLKIFLSAWSLNPAKRAALIRQCRPGVTLVWCYTPGYLYPDKADVAGIKEVTGFEATPVKLATAEVRPTEIGKGLGLTAPWGRKQPVSPLFSVKATKDETLAIYSDGSPAVAVRHSDKGTNVFVGVPQLTTELVRALARIAGVHLFTEGNATIWAAEGYLSVQTREDGPLVINTGEKGEVVDALDGKALGVGPEVTLDLKKGDVRVINTTTLPVSEITPTITAGHLLSPNGDGTNDFWEIDEIGKFGRVSVKICDRRGTIVYKSSDYQNDWDGKYNTQTLSEGAYIYFIKTETGIAQSGIINIVR
jgi:beta-galactosidase